LFGFATSSGKFSLRSKISKFPELRKRISPIFEANLRNKFGELRKRISPILETNLRNKFGEISNFPELRKRISPIFETKTRNKFGEISNFPELRKRISPILETHLAYFGNESAQQVRGTFLCEAKFQISTHCKKSFRTIEHLFCLVLRFIAFRFSNLLFKY
jgi:hypothetical protein